MPNWKLTQKQKEMKDRMAKRKEAQSELCRCGHHRMVHTYRCWVPKCECREFKGG